MTVPLLGTFSMGGFTHAWFFLVLAGVLALLAAYIVAQRRRRRRALRFANFDLLTTVSPPTRRRWRHVPAALLLASLALLTTAMAGPTDTVRVPRNRAVVMLVIDVSESMVSTDVAPNRLAAAKEAGKRFADELTPGINLGLVEFAGSATLLMAPTPDHEAVKASIDSLKAAERTATGEGLFTALQAVAATADVLGGGDGPPPARIVLESDGKETVPADPEEPRGAFTAARAAKEQHVEISTISFGTPDGTVTINGTEVPVPVDDSTLQQISEISGGQTFHASTLDQLNHVYDTLQSIIGYEMVPGDASAPWARLAALVLIAALATAVVVDRRLPV
ncbi:VWA domain-containing protein [Mycolicibacterium sp. 018/SC-01/001]|uniref:VWA domain-containing protein n=1 Tax=Mycolicibacterium sp. 018/SC-01/001 TaxID=2592069 RepID=UPI00117DB8FB|nr:VWA domain-containing protein [Mycolicibacterium sp. 018/SC-01/001]TRW82785.1 VWA domain-containing protein [Mycolicibacterium sp. 018/SC-01/001]